MAVFIATSSNELIESNSFELATNQTLPMDVKRCIKNFDIVETSVNGGEITDSDYSDENINVMTDKLVKIVLGSNVNFNEITLDTEATNGLNYIGYDSDGNLETSDLNISYYVIGDDSSNDSNGYSGDSLNVKVPSFWNGKPVVRIGKNAFKNSRISSITIGENVKYLSGSCFSSSDENSNLITIKLPNSCTEWFDSDGYNFSKTKIRDFTINSGVIEIPIGCFKGCPFLTSITIPDSVQKINELAFSNCDSLKEIKILSDEVIPLENINALSGNIERILVKKVLIDEYKTSLNWSHFSDYFYDLDGE